MIPAGGLNALRLLDAEGAPARPSGMVVPRGAVTDLAARLTRRAKHYPALRVTALPDALVFWSVADEVGLPWSDDDPLYLAQAGKAVFFPAGKRVALPGKWTEGVIDRLAAAKTLSRPILLLPTHLSFIAPAFEPGPAAPSANATVSGEWNRSRLEGRGDEDGHNRALRAIGLGKNSAPVPAVDWAELARP